MFAHAWDIRRQCAMRRHSARTREREVRSRQRRERQSTRKTHSTSTTSHSLHRGVNSTHAAGADRGRRDLCAQAGSHEEMRDAGAGGAGKERLVRRAVPRRSRRPLTHCAVCEAADKDIAGRQSKGKAVRGPFGAVQPHRRRRRRGRGHGGRSGRADRSDGLTGLSPESWPMGWLVRPSECRIVNLDPFFNAIVILVVVRTRRGRRFLRERVVVFSHSSTQKISQ